LNSGGAPKTMLAASGLSCAIELRWCLAANACVTVTESLSWAVVTAVPDGSTTVVSRAPLYSGMIVMAPFLISG
jgi:hypothetical protein